MTTHRGKRLLSLFLVVILCCCLVPPMTANAAGSALSMETVKELVNQETLYPQRTGYAALDALLEEIFAPYAGSDNYTKLKAAYDWTIRNIDYSWEGYVEQVYDGFAIDYPYDDYEEGLQEAIPYEVVARTYHALSAHKGVCYDWGAALAVMLRYVGFEAYVHTGYFVFEEGYGTGSGLHGWTEVVLDGEYYIFDPQRDYRMSANGTGTIPYYYFGIPYENAWRYTQHTEENAARDAGFLPVSAFRTQQVTVYAEASRSGMVYGAGTYTTGQTASLTAVSTGGNAFLGWYTTDGSFLSADLTLTFTVTEMTALAALFAGDVFYDIPAGSWYLDTVMNAVDAGIVTASGIRFDADEKLTRAEAVTLLARASGMEITTVAACPFTDLPADAETAAAIVWAWQNGIANGKTETTFAPYKLVSRQEFFVMLMRLLRLQGADIVGTALPFTDAAEIDAYAVADIAAGSALGLITGYEDGTLHPQENIDRASGVVLLMRALDYLKAETEAESEELEEEAPQAEADGAKETPAEEPVQTDDVDSVDAETAQDGTGEEDEEVRPPQAA